MEPAQKIASGPVARIECSLGGTGLLLHLVNGFRCDEIMDPGKVESDVWHGSFGLGSYNGFRAKVIKILLGIPLGFSSFFGLLMS